MKAHCKPVIQKLYETIVFFFNRILTINYKKPFKCLESVLVYLFTSFPIYIYIYIYTYKLDEIMQLSMY